MSVPTAYVVHTSPGRIRVRVPERKGDAAFFDVMAGRLRGVPGVSGITANPLTGSVLIQFTGEVATLALHAVAVLQDVQLERSPPPPQPLLQRVRQELAVADAAIRDHTGGQLDTGALLFLGLAAISAVQLLRGNVLAPAATLAWYAADILRRSQPEEAATQPSE